MAQVTAARRAAKNDATFEDRHNFKVSEIMQGSTKELMKGIKDTASKLAYQGFDPLKIAQTVKRIADNNSRSLEDDLFFLIILFYCRGVNSDRLKNMNSSRISDEPTQNFCTTGPNLIKPICPISLLEPSRYWR